MIIKSVNLTIVLQSSGAQRLFDHPVLMNNELGSSGLRPWPSLRYHLGIWTATQTKYKTLYKTPPQDLNPEPFNTEQLW